MRFLSQAIIHWKILMDFLCNSWIVLLDTINSVASNKHYTESKALSFFLICRHCPFENIPHSISHCRNLQVQQNNAALPYSIMINGVCLLNCGNAFFTNVPDQCFSLRIITIIRIISIFQWEQQIQQLNNICDCWSSCLAHVQLLYSVLAWSEWYFISLSSFPFEFKFRFKND